MDAAETGSIFVKGLFSGRPFILRRVSGRVVFHFLARKTIALFPMMENIGRVPEENFQH